MVDDRCAVRKQPARFFVRLLTTLSALPLLVAGCSALFSASDISLDPDAGEDGVADAAVTECSSQSDGTSCSTGICLGGDCLSAEETMLPGTDLSIHDSNSTQTDDLV